MRLNIFETKVEQVKNYINEVNKAIKPLGMNIACKVLNKTKVVVVKDNNEDITINCVSLSITTSSLKSEDWKLIGTIQHTDNGNIVTCFQKNPLSEIYNVAPYICDFCDDISNRNVSFIIKNVKNDKEEKQVCYDCLKNYAKINNKKAFIIMQIFNKLLKFEHFNKEEIIKNLNYIDVKLMLKIVNFVTNKYGFVKAKEKNPTKDIVFNFYKQIINNNDYKKDIVTIKNNNEDIVINLKEQEEAVNEVVAFAKNRGRMNYPIMDNDKSYFSKLTSVCRTDITNAENVKILASTFSFYNKLKNLNPSSVNRASTYVGTIGDRIVVGLVKCIILATWRDIGNETIYLYKFEDRDGNIYVWKTYKVLDTSKEMVLKCTVKAHNLYKKQEKQTEITRCKLIA